MKTGNRPSDPGRGASHDDRSEPPELRNDPGDGTARHATTDPVDRNLLDIAKQTSGVMTSRAVGMAIGFASNIVFARLLGAELLGVYVLASTTLLFLSLLASFGMGHTFVRYMPVSLSRNDRAAAAGVFRLGTRTVLVSSVLFGLLLLALRRAVAGPIFHEPLLLPILPIVALGTVGATFQLVLGHTLRALKRTAQESFCLEIVNKTAKLVLFLALVAAGMKLAGITVAFVAAYFVSAVTMLALIGRRAPFLFRGPSRLPVPVREIAAFSSMMLFVGFMNYSLSISDRMMLGILGTSEDVGIYNIAFLISNVMAMVFMGFNSSFAPVISELYHNDRSSELRSLYSSLTRTILLIVVPAFCWLTGFGDDLLRVFGDEFADGYIALVILGVGVVVRCTVGTVGTMLVMSGHQKFNAANIVIVTAMNVGLNIVLIPRYGLLGAAIATAVSVSLIDIVGLLEVRLLIKIHPYRRAFLKVLLASLAALAGNVALRAVTPALPPVAILGILAATYALFVGLLALMGLEREDRLLITKAISRIRRRG
ncbi:MAG: oligosaccharide flippase family protein [Candidatus Eisenbacteria bacterium]|nr:oligosaccharide flippase family protein [Candidatus Eisenbacteria bacterium]